MQRLEEHFESMSFKVVDFFFHKLKNKHNDLSLLVHFSKYTLVGNIWGEFNFFVHSSIIVTSLDFLQFSISQDIYV